MAVTKRKFYNLKAKNGSLKRKEALDHPVKVIFVRMCELSLETQTSIVLVIIFPLSCECYIVFHPRNIILERTGSHHREL